MLRSIAVLTILTFGQVGLANENIQHLKIGKPDVSALKAQDKQEVRKDVAIRFAKPIPVSVTPTTDGTWKSENGIAVWQLRLSSEDAVSLNLGFKKFFLPEGASLTIGSADGKQMMGRSFTSADNENHGQLWTPVIESDDIILRLEVAAAQKDLVQLELHSFNYGYRKLGERVEKSGSCNVDTVCEEGDLWQDQIRSVVVISRGGSRFCTGFLVNNVRQDMKPFFMTAKHCGMNSGNAASLVAYWNYQNSTCREPGSSSSGRRGDGQLTQFTTGATFRSDLSRSDFALLEFDDAIDPEFNVYFAGWDATDVDADQAIAIHHPNVDEKRISFEYDATSTTDYLGYDSPGNGSHVLVDDWDVGTTEPGSSGSPLFNAAGQVIGQLHGGYAACGNDRADWYGRFSVSWDYSDDTDEQLKHWLDPDDTGMEVIDGLDSAAK